MENKKNLVKMYVLPEETFNKWKVSVDYVKSFSPFDREMKRILYDKKLNDVTKWHLYRQNLMKYTNMKRQNINMERVEKNKNVNSTIQNIQQQRTKRKPVMYDASAQTKYVFTNEKEMQTTPVKFSSVTTQSQFLNDDIFDTGNSDVEPGTSDSHTPLPRLSAMGVARSSFHRNKAKDSTSTNFVEISDDSPEQTTPVKRNVKEVDYRVVETPGGSVYTVPIEAEHEFEEYRRKKRKSPTAKVQLNVLRKSKIIPGQSELNYPIKKNTRSQKSKNSQSGGKRRFFEWSRIPKHL